MRMLENNPKTKPAMDYIQQHGGNPETAFYTLAKEKGADPNQVLKQVKEQSKDLF